MYIGKEPTVPCFIAAATLAVGGSLIPGQSQGDDILIDVRQHWSGSEVEDNGSRVRCNVGTTLGRINEVLKLYARRK